MNSPSSNTPSVAEIAHDILVGRTLIAGQPFYAAGEGVMIVISILPPGESIGEANHELTISTGFPPNPAAAGIGVYLQRRGQAGEQLERIGETDCFGALMFSPGEPNTQYQLTVTRSSAAKVDSDCSTILPFTATNFTRFRRSESRLADAAAEWIAVTEGAVSLSTRPLDSSLCFSFVDTPTALAYISVRAPGNRVFHDLFPLRSIPGGQLMEGRIHLPVDGDWDELVVEPCTPELVARFEPAVREILAFRLQERLLDWSEERPRDDKPARYRDLWYPIAAALAGTTPDAALPMCPVCRLWSEGWVAKLNGLRSGLAASAPVCRAHLTGPDGTILAAARDAWQRRTPEVFAVCGTLLTELLDEENAIRKGFLQSYPSDLREQALSQAAGVLLTVSAVGHVLAKRQTQALTAGRAAAEHFQKALCVDRTRRAHFTGRQMNAAPHPLFGLWAPLATEATQGFLAFRRLSAAITEQESDPPPFRAMRPRPVIVRAPLYDRERATAMLARLEFLPVAEGCSELYLDVAPLGFRVPDPQFLRSLESAWRAVQPTLAREHPEMAVRVRVTFGDDDSPAPALQGASAGLAIAVGLLAVARGEVLDEDTAIAGELIPAAGTELTQAGAGWTNRVPEKLQAARLRGLTRAVVGITEEGTRYPGRLDRGVNPDFAVVPACTVGDAYQLLTRGSCIPLAVLQDESRRRSLLHEWVAALPRTTRPETDAGVLRKLFSAHQMLQGAGAHNLAGNLIREFEAALKAEGVITLEQHQKILGMLSAGAAIEPLPELQPEADITLGTLQDETRRRALFREWIEALPRTSRPETDTDILRRVISAYRSLQLSGATDLAIHLIGEFETALKAHNAITSEQLQLILETLRFGLPLHTPHGLQMETSVEEMLTRPGYPSLLRALRVAEIDPSRAVREFESLVRLPMFQQSAFVWYLFGQALRKEDRVWESLKALERAEQFIRDGIDSATDDVRLEVFRGLGAVCRKIAKRKLDRQLGGFSTSSEDDTGDWQHFRDRAEAYFHAGEPLIRRLVGLHRTSAAEFHHSYGYFHLQFGYLAWKLGGRTDVEAFRAALRNAEEHFALSAKCDPNWGAPDARLQFTRHKLFQLGDAEAGSELEAAYVQARAKSAKEAESMPEAGLTEIVCGCGQLLLGSPDSALNAEPLLAALVERLCRRVESKGARQCHAFDLEFLVDGVDAHALAGILGGFRMAANWDQLDYATFIFTQMQTRRDAGSLDLATSLNWIENARKLVTEALSDKPGDPIAESLRDTLLKWPPHRA